MTQPTCPSCGALWVVGSPICPRCSYDAHAAAALRGTLVPPWAVPPAAAPPPPASNTRKIVAGVVGVFVLLALVGVVWDRMQPEPTGDHALSKVCEGDGVSGAAEYDVAANKVEVVVLEHGEGGWDLASDEAGDRAPLVACRTWDEDPSHNRYCDFRTRDYGELVSVRVWFQNAEVVVRESRTGEIIGRHEVVKESPSCPRTAVVTGSQDEVTVYPHREAKAVVDQYRGGGS